tara:strand:- start:90 stop:197 length:108 start_codon:yes stop_codon:yes gene_type:complete
MNAQLNFDAVNMYDADELIGFLLQLDEPDLGKHHI